MHDDDAPGGCGCGCATLTALAGIVGLGAALVTVADPWRAPALALAVGLWVGAAWGLSMLSSRRTIPRSADPP